MNKAEASLQNSDEQQPLIYAECGKVVEADDAMQSQYRGSYLILAFAGNRSNTAREKSGASLLSATIVASSFAQS